MQNATSEKKALEHKKEIAKRLGRPLIQTNFYEDDTAFEKQSALFALVVSDMEPWLPTAWSSRVTFIVDDFHSAIEKYDFNSEIGTKVRGTVFCTDNGGALVNITAKSSTHLPLQEASIHRLKHVEEAGIVSGLKMDFVIIGENEYDLAWERCRQLQAEDVVVKGKVVGANKGGVVAVVEGLRGFVPFSQISSVLCLGDLLLWTDRILRIVSNNNIMFHLNDPLAEDLMSFYERMGDTLAHQYCGSAGMFSFILLLLYLIWYLISPCAQFAYIFLNCDVEQIFSQRRGQWKAATQSQEFFRTLQRYYSNAYMDAEKQDAIN
ncbi:hypothetical protein F8388_023972, partial [Cannabis sativa]